MKGGAESPDCLPLCFYLRERRATEAARLPASRLSMYRYESTADQQARQWDRSMVNTT